MYRDYQLTIDKIFRYALYIAPDQEMVYAPPNLPKIRFTYRDFTKRVNSLGWILDDFDMKKAEKPWEMGTRVAVMDWNTIRFQELMYAIPMYGATLYTVNIRLAPEEIIYTMNMAEPEILFINSDFLKYLNPILQLVRTIKRVVVMDDKTTCRVDKEFPEIGVPERIVIDEYEKLIREAPKEEFSWPSLDEYVVAGTFFTSGTTGRPKGIYHTHRQIILSSLQLIIPIMEYPMRSSNRDINIMLVPYFHIFGWMQPYYLMILGNKMIFPGRYEWKNITKLITEYLPEAEKINGMVTASGVPTMLYSIIQEMKTIGIKDLRRFSFGYGGEALPISVYEEAKKLGIKIITGYGPSETLTAITRLWAIPRLWMKMGMDDEKIIDYFVINNSLGIPVPLSFVKAVNDEGNEVPMNGETPGRALFYAPSITREYYKDREKTEKAWRYGMFDVEDMVAIDEYGSILFVDREKDAIKSGGEWIPSSRLEGFISTHPSVAEVAVIGVSHPKWVERPVAVIVLKPDFRESVSENKIHEYLQKNFVEGGLMPRWWMPDKIIFVDSLPKTSTAKIDKKTVREKYSNILGI